MATPSIYSNLDDSVAKVIERIKRERSEEMVLVCPKRCFLFSDPSYLLELKKQTDLLQKTVFILTMDEKGQKYAQEAGFQLKFLPNAGTQKVSDIKQAVVEKPVKKVVSSIPVNKVEKKEQQVKKMETVFVPAVSPRIEVTDRIFPQDQEIQIVEKEQQLEQEVAQQIQTKPKKTLAFVLSFLSIVVLFGSLFFILPSANITIFPKKEVVVRDFEVNINVNSKEADVARLILPATKIDQSLEVTDKFESLGKKDVGNKARGFIKIYNFNKLPINLKASTTTLTIGNKNFYLEQDVQILPTEYKNIITKEIDQDSVGPEIPVIASEGGESFNMPVELRVEITNKVFGSKPKVLFGKVTTAILGGTTRFLSYVSEQDINNSKQQLKEKLIENLNKSLKDKNLLLPEKSFSIEILKFTTDKNIGTESPNFSANLRATVSGLAISEKQLKSLISDRILKTIGSSKTISENEKNLFQYYSKSEVYLGSESGILSVHFEGQLINKIDIESFKLLLKGKNEGEIAEVVKEYPEIERVDVVIKPAWWKTVPDFLSKIYIKIEQ